MKLMLEVVLHKHLLDYHLYIMSLNSNKSLSLLAQTSIIMISTFVYIYFFIVFEYLCGCMSHSICMASKDNLQSTLSIYHVEIKLMLSHLLARALTYQPIIFDLKIHLEKTGLSLIRVLCNNSERKATPFKYKLKRRGKYLSKLLMFPLSTPILPSSASFCLITAVSLRCRT